MPTGQTALILPVPEAEPLVHTWRARFDKHAAQGVPAHVTLLSPFLPEAAARAALPRVLGLLGRRTPRFTFRALVRWPGLAVLRPEPDDWFRRITRALCEAHGLLPYAGKHGATFEPHLTVAYGAEVPALTRARFDAIAADLDPRLPLTCVGRQVQLIVREGQRWRLAEALEIAP